MRVHQSGIPRRSSLWLLAIGAVALLVAAPAIPEVPSALASSPNQSISVDPSSAAPGTVVNLSGRSFPKRVAVSVVWDGSTSGMPTTYTQPNGSFGVDVRIPSGATLGTHSLGVISGTIHMSTSFKVVTGVVPTSTPVPATPTSVPPPGTATATAVPRTPTPASTATPAPPPSGSCNTTLQTLINNAASGSTLMVPPCNYFESITINKPLILDGQGQAQLFASDVWTGWTLSNGLYVSSQSVPTFSTANQGMCASATPHCNWPEQVFIDGRPLIQTASGSTPANGQFSLDSSRRVRMADNPTGHTVQVTTRESWVNTQADNVTIQNFTFWHGANAAQTGMIGNQGHNGWTLQNSKLYYSHGGIVSLGGAANTNTRTRVLNNVIAGGSYAGIIGYRNNNTLIQGNTIFNTNLAGFDCSWSCGGMKPVAFTNMIVDSNTIYDTGGPGIWCDIGCNNVTISNNRIHNASGSPIMYEISDNAQIYGNVIYDSQGWGSFNVATSAHVNLYNNFVARAPDIHTALEGGSLYAPVCSCNVRGDAFIPPGSTQTDAGGWISFHDNQLVSPTTGLATSWQDLANDHFGRTVYSNSDTNNVILTGTAASDALAKHGVPATAQ